MISQKALKLLEAIFADNSNLQLPVFVAKEIIEIKEWIKEELKKQNAQSTDKTP